MRKYDDARLLPIETFMALGRERAAVGRCDALVDAGTGDDIAALCTTSGTTSHPKLAMIPGGGFLRHCDATLAADPIGTGDQSLANTHQPWTAEHSHTPT